MKQLTAMVIGLLMVGWVLAGDLRIAWTDGTNVYAAGSGATNQVGGGVWYGTATNASLLQGLTGAQWTNGLANVGKTNVFTETNTFTKLILGTATNAWVKRIAPSKVRGGYDFTEQFYYGPVWQVAWSDTDAFIMAVFHVEHSGTYKPVICFAKDAATTSATASGKISVRNDLMGTSQTNSAASFIVDGANWDLTLVDDAVIYTDVTYGTGINIVGPGFVLVMWSKDDNAGGASGSMCIYNILLERQ